MDWLLAIMLAYSSLGSASDAYDQQQEAIKAANLQVEISMFEDAASAEATISELFAIIPNIIQQGDAILVRSQTEQSVTPLWTGILCNSTCFNEYEAR